MFSIQDSVPRFGATNGDGCEWESTLAVRGAEDVALRRQHHVVEILGEHCCCEERNRSQRLLTDIDEVVFYWCRDSKNTPWTDLMSGAVFHVQFAGAGDDVLRFFCGNCVPT